MGTTLTARVHAGITGNYIQELGDQAGQVNHPISFERTITFTNGIGKNQADIFWGDKARTISESANDDINIFDGGTIDIGPGVGRDPLGNDLAIAKIVTLFIYNHASSAGNLVIGNAASNPWTAILSGTTPTVGPITPGGLIELVAPDATAWAVTDASNNILRINASGGDVVFDIAILARTAAP